MSFYAGYPKRKYSIHGGSVTVTDPVQEKSLGEGWVDTMPPPPPPDDEDEDEDEDGTVYPVKRGRGRPRKYPLPEATQ
jgi:hypothetical protein